MKNAKVKKSGVETRKELVAKVAIVFLVVLVIASGIISYSKPKKDGFDSNATQGFIAKVIFFANPQAIDPSNPNFVTESMKNSDGSPCESEMSMYMGGDKLKLSKNTSIRNWLNENASGEHKDKAEYYFKGFYSVGLRSIIDPEEQVVGGSFLNDREGTYSGDLIAIWEFRPVYTVKVNDGLGGSEKEFTIRHTESTASIPAVMTDFSITSGLPANVEREDHIFEGWFRDPTFTPESKVDDMNNILGLPVLDATHQYTFALANTNDKVNVYENGNIIKTINLKVKLYAKWKVENVLKEDGTNTGGDNGGGNTGGGDGTNTGGGNTGGGDGTNTGGGNGGGNTGGGDGTNTGGDNGGGNTGGGNTGGGDGTNTGGDNTGGGDGTNTGGGNTGGEDGTNTGGGNGGANTGDNASGSNGNGSGSDKTGNNDNQLSNSKSSNLGQSNNADDEIVSLNAKDLVSKALKEKAKAKKALTKGSKNLNGVFKTHTPFGESKNMVFVFAALIFSIIVFSLIAKALIKITEKK